MFNLAIVQSRPGLRCLLAYRRRSCTPCGTTFGLIVCTLLIMIHHSFQWESKTIASWIHLSRSLSFNWNVQLRLSPCTITKALCFPISPGKLMQCYVVWHRNLFEKKIYPFRWISLHLQQMFSISYLATNPWWNRPILLQSQGLQLTRGCHPLNFAWPKSFDKYISTVAQ